MALNPGDPMVQLAQFGRQVELFKNSDIGQFIYDRAEKQINEAMHDLKSADPYSPQRVQALQNKVVVAESIINWLEEAIAVGQDAMEQLKNA